MLPEIKLSTTQCIFKDVKYGHSQSIAVTLENIGQVVSEFIFVAKPNDVDIHKQWLKIEPLGGIIIPQEKITITFTVLVDHATAPKLNNGKDTIDDIIILHLKNGRDHFVSVALCKLTIISSLLLAITCRRALEMIWKSLLHFLVPYAHVLHP